MICFSLLVLQPSLKQIGSSFSQLNMKFFVFMNGNRATLENFYYITYPDEKKNLIIPSNAYA